MCISFFRHPIVVISESISRRAAERELAKLPSFDLVTVGCYAELKNQRYAA